ncbi:MAG TPA: PrpF domain-containing protein [Burkholderiaceae bacterium]|nr:PrpF domain-containing protein [Burkholderiaceae bacterium]
MTQQALPASFMRGGTSKALVVQRDHLPENESEWPALFMAAMGTPDPYGRQLDGMGGGVSSLSKVCIVAPSAHPDADVDYTFAQVMVKEAHVDYRGNCGNMSSAVGPFAIDQGLVPATGEQTTVRIYNTNTKKIIHSTFQTRDGRALYQGDLAIPGVSGTGSPVQLDFIDPGGATTGKLLPTGQVTDQLDVPGMDTLEVSMVDAANAVVFVRAADIGLTGLELPDELEARPDLLKQLNDIRIHASVAMGIAPDIESARHITIVPFIAVVRDPTDNPTLSGETVSVEDIDLIARVISNGQPHRALPLTASLCTAVAARIQGTVVSQVLSPYAADDVIRLGMPSGILTVGADVNEREGEWVADSGSFYRTARLLFDGQVYVPGTDDA